MKKLTLIIAIFLLALLSYLLLSEESVQEPSIIASESSQNDFSENTSGELIEPEISQEHARAVIPRPEETEENENPIALPNTPISERRLDPRVQERLQNQVNTSEETEETEEIVNNESNAHAEFRDRVRETFLENTDELRECYMLVLDLEPDLSDRLSANITVSSAEDGDSEFGIANLDTIEAEEMGLEHLSCFAEVINEMQFPAPANNGEYSIRYPLFLSPNEE